MVETVFLDWGLSFGAGLLFALAGGADARRERFASRAFRWGLAYLHLGVIAISVVLYLLEPDWMWMYWVDAATLPVAVHVLAFVIYEICFLAGFTLAAELGRRPAWALVAVTGAAITATEVATRTRLFHLGTFAEYAAGTAPAAVATDPLRIEAAWWVVVIGGAASIAGLLLALRSLVHSGRASVASQAAPAVKV